MAQENGITEEEREELVGFLFNNRKVRIQYWWIGTLDPSADDTDLISNTLRGGYVDDIWKPLKWEYADECCDEYEQRFKAGDLDEDGFEFMRHCVTKEHIRNLVNKRTDEQLQREYQYMLEVTMSAIEESI